MTGLATVRLLQNDLAREQYLALACSICDLHDGALLDSGRLGLGSKPSRLPSGPLTPRSSSRRCSPWRSPAAAAEQVTPRTLSAVGGHRLCDLDRPESQPDSKDRGLGAQAGARFERRLA